MDTRQLAAFCAVVERESFSQAAVRLGVTQPAVSQQVRALEKRIGQQLLDRSGRRVVPTEAGLRLYHGAQRLLALEEQLLEQVAAEDEGALRVVHRKGNRQLRVAQLELAEEERDDVRAGPSGRADLEATAQRALVLGGDLF